jgi:short-subunit dehydrogenase
MAVKDMQKAVIIASKENGLAPLANELRKREIEVSVLLREDFSSTAMFAEAAEREGKVDYLFISALCDKALENKNLAELTTEEYKTWKYYALKQFYEISATFVKKMVGNGGGKVIGIISEAGAIPSFGQCLNGGAGAALAMGLQSMAAESTEDNIFTNTVAVGGTVGEDRFMRDVESYIMHVPGKALISEDEVAKKIVDILMLTDKNMTGNVMTIDAGFSCAFMREW